VAAEKGHAPKRVYLGQDGALHLNQGQVFDGDEKTVGLKVTITPAAGSANVCLVTFQVQDGQGNNVAQAFELLVYLSDDPAGNGLTATTASGTVGAGANGTDLSAKVSKKAIDVLTDTTGKYILSITDNAKTGFYPCCTTPGTGVVQAGAQLVTGNYG
jgi:hypothetical protein